jgi:hypothetical protein
MISIVTDIVTLGTRPPEHWQRCQNGRRTTAAPSLASLNASEIASDEKAVDVTVHKGFNRDRNPLIEPQNLRVSIFG